MKELIVDVLLWDKLVGSLVWDEHRDVAVFEFAKYYRSYGLELSPLINRVGLSLIFLGLGLRLVVQSPKPLSLSMKEPRRCVQDK